MGVSYTAATPWPSGFEDFISPPLPNVWESTSTSTTSTFTCPNGSSGTSYSQRSSPLSQGTTFQITITYCPNLDHRLQLSCTTCKAADFTRAWPVIEFIPQGTPDYKAVKGGPRIGDALNRGRGSYYVDSHSTYGMKPGSDLYYLTKLGRLELLGLPQIFFEPLYCNSNMSKLVPGLYSDLEKREEVEKVSSTNGYQGLVDPDIQVNPGRTVSGDSWVAGQDNHFGFILDQKHIAATPVFDENELICCAGLGQKVSSAQRCCTNHTLERNGEFQCALPPKTDLMVYFNRFISGEGKFDSEKEPSGLTFEDFNPKTGEPKLRQSTYDKIRTLGQKHCDNEESEKTRTGAAMGNYFIEPLPGRGNVIAPSPTDSSLRRYGIVDSLRDSSVDGEKGYFAFMEGFRWNHHLYCK